MEAIVIEVKNEADAKFWLNLAKKQEPRPEQSILKKLKMTNLPH